MNPEKPGYLSTEFWRTIGIDVIAVAKTLGWLPAADMTTAEGWWKELVVSAGILLAAIVSGYTYVKGRIDLKKTKLLANASTNTSVNATV